MVRNILQIVITIVFSIIMIIIMVAAVMAFPIYAFYKLTVGSKPLVCPYCKTEMVGDFFFAFAANCPKCGYVER